MEPIRIWFNRNYSTTVHLTNMVRHNADGVPVVVFGSHVDTGSPMLTNCDHRLPEPSRTDADFVDQVLELCSAHRIDVLVPMAGQSLIAHRAAEFAAVGTALICPSASAIDVLADKAATYLALPGTHSCHHGGSFDPWQSSTKRRPNWTASGRPTGPWC